MLLTIVAIVAVLGGLIFFHELGHFAVARTLGMGVSVFSLGFGPKLLKYKAGKTEYALSLVPLGGYVALVGETDAEDMPEGFTREENFSLRPAWQRLLVVVAGPVANILLALLICWILAFGWGIKLLQPEVGAVADGSPAAVAGIAAGDRILTINDRAIESWDEMSATIGQGKGAPLRIEVGRPDAGQSFTTLRFTVTPMLSERKTIFGDNEKAWLIGIRPSGAMAAKTLNPSEAISAGTQQAVRMISLTWQSLVKLVQRVVPLDQVGGPIMIGKMVSEQAHQGLDGLLALTALISINLGILNLLPIPVLDGGTILFCLVEMIFRKPVNEKAQEYAMRAGIAVLVCLMLLATFNDVLRLINAG